MGFPTAVQTAEKAGPSHWAPENTPIYAGDGNLRNLSEAQSVKASQRE